ncbi:MAG: YfiR family protein [Methylococcaceae bacterium]|nr:YfiR family protein [Methylococcaceae bacterium]
MSKLNTIFGVVSRLLLYGAIMLCVCGSAFADATQEYTVKAAIALNFARFTEWPESALKLNAQEITLCVLGDNVAEEAFLQMDGKKVGNRSLYVIYLSRPRNLEQCQLLYVSGLDKNTTIQLLTEIKNQPILTIGEQRYFTDYHGMINLDMQNGKVDIQINLEATKQAGLAVSSRVLKIATIVKSR